jgi:hypothetical protein
MTRLACGCVPDDTRVPPRRSSDLRDLLSERRGLAQQADSEPDAECRATLWHHHHGLTVEIAAHLAPAVQEEARRAAA